MALTGRRILVGLGGSIAAFKTVELVRTLMLRGADVRVAMTEAATRFVGPTTFAGITGKAVAVDLWDRTYPGEIHVELAHWADAIVVAPATANTIARAVAGIADDVLLATLLCAACPIFYAPAMHERMWLAHSTQRNIGRLCQDGARMIGPVKGRLANGQEGMGRMEAPERIADALEKALSTVQDLSGKTILVTAGPTLEDLDPVRFIGNRSTGRMGYAIAKRAQERGAEVILVSGPVAIEPPAGVALVPVRSAREMQRAVTESAHAADAVIMSAAVADYRPKVGHEHKMKKTADTLQLELVKNPDILAGLGQVRKENRPILVGFAVETEDVIAYARKKLVDKKVDLVVANEASVGFGGEETKVTLVSHAGDEPLPPMSKLDTADRILDRIASLLGP
jgi:phosphopantothenoylcysteine decarboxylase/phosphopantothenate--cysteine ligase